MNVLYETASPNPGGHRDIDPAHVAPASSKVRLVDVREPDEYTGELGHVSGAELVPLATVEGAAQGWDREQEIVMICRSGARSGRAAALLTSMGFRHVMNMVGGMLAWNAAHLPTER
jgi:sulfur-carrier protein adenylyltransferase/sulfurtransferase